MSLDIDRLEKPRLRGGKLIARCPACAEIGADRSGEHLSIEDEGRGAYHCIVDSDGAGGQHSKRVWELAGIRGMCRGVAYPATPKARSTPAKAKPRLPTLRPLNVAEMAAIVHLRGWPSFAGMELLTRRGLLWQGMVWDDGREWPAWIITDSRRRNAQARRLDGQPWVGIGGQKAKTPPGSDAPWPIGAAEIGERLTVLLCEGGPDFLAALLVAWWERDGASVDEVAPVCMTGAVHSIPADALPLFAGKRVRILVHKDDAGFKAARRWAGQLSNAGAAQVDGFDFSGLVRRDGQPVKDLADFATQLDLEHSPTSYITEGLPVGRSALVCS